MKNMIILVLLSLFTYTTLSQTQQAVAVLRDINSGSNNPIYGTIYFINNGTGTTTFVRMNITNIDDGAYGVHIHEFGDFRGFVPDAVQDLSEWRALGDVFNPDNSSRACTDNSSLSASSVFGDLGNWNASSGISEERALSRLLPFSGATSLVGRTVVIYNSADTCENGELNIPGIPIAVGLIGIANLPTGNEQTDAAPGITRGICVLRGTSLCNGDNNECDFGQSGVFIFEQNATTNGVRIFGVVNGLNGTRGIHVHQFGDLTDPSGLSAGEHYNPYLYQHGLPGINSQRHLGDLGNIQNLNDNKAYYDYTPVFPRAITFTVDGLIGRSLIIHTGFDHGNDPTCSEGSTTGNSGQREYICVIGIANSNDNDTLFVPVVPSSLTNINNTFTQVPCTGGNDNNNGTTNGTTTTGAPTSGVVVGPTDGEDNWDWSVPEDASAGALVGSFFLLLIINLVVLFV